MLVRLTFLLELLLLGLPAMAQDMPEVSSPHLICGKIKNSYILVNVKYESIWYLSSTKKWDKIFKSSPSSKMFDGIKARKWQIMYKYPNYADTLLGPDLTGVVRAQANWDAAPKWARDVAFSFEESKKAPTLRLLGPDIERKCKLLKKD